LENVKTGIESISLIQFQQQKFRIEEAIAPDVIAYKKEKSFLQPPSCLGRSRVASGCCMLPLGVA
jgi:hypothetical protein